MGNEKVYESVITEFKPKARLLLQLGDQLIRNEKIALSELIKNSYDAGARKVLVIMNDIDEENFSKGTIVIQDDGIGMNINTIKEIWMEPGTNNKEKKYEANFTGYLNRRPIGEKGIGRFGVHKLGNKIRIISKQQNHAEVVFEIDWNLFEANDYLSEKKIFIQERIDTLFTNGKTGTFIEITDLRNYWTLKDFRDLYRSAFSLCSPFKTLDSFEIEIKTNLVGWKEKLPKLEDIQQYALWYFECTINELKNQKEEQETLITQFLYEFRPKVKMSVAPTTITHEDDYIKANPYIRLEKDPERMKKEEKIYKQALEEYKDSLSYNKDKKILLELKKPEKPSNFFDPSLQDIGEITMKGYIFDFDKDTLELSDIDDIAGFKDYTKANGGVRVYRDNMRIYDYGEEGNDWLELDAKRINASTIKISNRNIIASVFLNGSSSIGLKEKTNREGFIENKTYENFREIVRTITKKITTLRNNDKDALKRTYFQEQDATINANILINKTKQKVSQYITDMQNKKEVLDLIEKVEENYNSVKDIVLKSSGAGLAYSLVMHEIEKMISSLEESVKNKDYNELSEISKALSSAVDNITSLLTNDKVKSISIYELINKAFYFFKRRFKKHDIEIIQAYNEKKQYFVSCLNNLSLNAIMNILDNAIYWLCYWKKDLDTNTKIHVDIIEQENFINLIIADNGKGFYISEDIAKLPFKTTKDNSLGKGLGLYFVNEIMKQNNGNLKIITNKNYKREDLNIPDEFINGATIILQFKKG